MIPGFLRRQSNHSTIPPGTKNTMTVRKNELQIGRKKDRMKKLKAPEFRKRRYTT